MFAPILVCAAVAATITPQQRAMAAVDSAVIRMGGAQKLAAIKRIERDLVGTRPDRGQGESPLKPDDAPVREILARDGTSRIANALDLKIRGGLRLRLRSVSDGQNSFQVNYENGTQTKFPSAGATPFLQAVLRRFPERLLLTAQRRPEALRWLGTQKIDGRTYDVVAYGGADGGVDDLYFDAGSHDLSRVSRLNDDPIRGDAPVATIYTDYRESQGFRFPNRILGLQGLDTVSDVVVQRLALDGAVDDSLFSEPTGLPLTPATAQNTSLVSLGSDAYLVKGRYNSAFVVFDDYVLVLEAPVSSGYQEGVIALIDSVAHGKPIRYVVATHFHFDHLGGLRPYIARGATIVTTRAAADVIRSLPAVPHSLRPDTLSKAPVSAKIEIVGDRRTFTDSHHAVSTTLLRNMPHVPEILVAYIPSIRTLFEGDLYDSYAVEEVPASDDGEKLTAWLAGSGLDVQSIIPVHGPEAPVPVSALGRAHALRLKR